MSYQDDEISSNIINKNFKFLLSVFKRLQTNLNSLLPTNFSNLMNLYNRDLRKQVNVSYLNINFKNTKLCH